MNYGALFFLAGFVALASSWCGLVLVPQIQVGRQDMVTTADGAVYPARRPGLAEQGAQVYRANGCVACHSQQVRQTGTVFDVVLNEVGTNPPVVLTAVKEINPTLDTNALAALPKDLLSGVDKAKADAADDALKKSGAKYSIRIRPIGPDMDRSWGLRATVAQDYLQDAPVFLGAQRLGPDLANVGARKSDANWHYLHLYAPASNVDGSTMPPYRFLFEQRKIGRAPSPAALHLTGALAPKDGYEIVPSEQAVALVAYLMSLRADAPLYEAPISLK